MPESNKSTSASHLTSLTIDISQLQKQLQTVDKNMADTANKAVQSANKIKDSFKNINSLGVSGGLTKGISSGINKATSSISQLEARILNLQKRIASSPMNNVAYDNMAAKVDRAAERIISLNNILRQGGTLSKQQQKQVQSLARTYDDMSKAMTKLETYYFKTGDAINVTSNKISELITKYKQWQKQIATSPAKGQDGFANIEQRISTIIARLQELHAESAKTGVTPAIAKEYGQLNAEMTVLKGNVADITRLWQEQSNAIKIIEQQAKSVKELDKSYQSLSQKIVQSQLLPQSVSNISTAVEQARQELRAYNNIIQSGNQLTEAQAQRVGVLTSQLTNLNTQLKDTYINAIQSGQGFKTGADAITNLQAKARDFNKYAREAQSFFKQFINGKTILDETSQQFITMRNQAKGLVDALRGLNASFISKGGIVSRQDYAQLLQYVNALENLKLQLGQAEEAAKLTGQGLRQVTTVNVQDIERAALAYAQLTNQMQGKKVTDTSLNALIQQAKGYEQVLNNLVRNANILGTVTPQMAQQFQQVNNALIPLRHQLANLDPQIGQLQQQYRKMEQEIRSTISSLNKLEQAAVTDKGRRQVSNLRQQYEQLAQTLRTMPVADAQSRLAALNTSFNDLSRTVPTATGWVNRFVEAITNRARWMLAYGILNSIFTSFTNIIKVIRETEDSVIELQRVLSNPPAQGDMAGELNQIAYEYGQTFANVQEVAVRFAQTGMDWNETIEATRATMLGLNTAELEVNTATQGLIAVMAQFHIEAEDLEDVIDKINITADNFPVTSEKIVAALQRAGGTASAFGMSLEQTIGTITALSEATGRSGEAIGTAMNSLISFTMKESSLKTFAQYFSQIEGKAHLTAEALKEMNVFDVWTNLSQAIQNSGDELAQMLATSSDFTDLMNEEIATATGLTDEYNAAVAETNQQLVDQEDIYSTVGVYRKNYFIALLNYISTAQDAIENMNGAIGYSQQENVTAMEALSKQFNQLIVAARELAVQFGESGFLNILKDLTAVATGVLHLTKNVGGLTTVMLGLTAVLFKVKGLKLASMLKTLEVLFNSLHLTLVKAFTRARSSVVLFNASLKRGNTIAAAFRNTVLSLKLTMGDFLVVITLVVAAIQSIIGKFDEYNEKQRESRQAAIELGNETEEQINRIYEAYQKLEQAQSYNVPKNLTQALEDYNKELEEAANKNINLSKTIYGNIDTEARNAIEWTEENLQRYKSEIQSWGVELDKLRGTVTSVFGQSGKFDGVEIAFSPMLQTETGAVLLSSDTLNKYLNTLIERAGDGYTANDLIRLDTTGIETDGVVIKNIIADIGKTAQDTVEQINYIGDFDGVGQSWSNLQKYEQVSIQQAEDLRKAQVELLEVLGYTKEDIPILTKRYSEMGIEINSLDELMQQLLDDTNAVNKANMEIALAENKQSFKDLEMGLLNVKEATEQETAALSLLDNEYKGLIKHAETPYSFKLLNRDDYDQAKETISSLNNVVSKMRETWTSEELASNRVYQQMIKWIDTLQKKVAEVDKQEEQVKLIGSSWEETAKNMAKAQMQIDKFVDGTEEAILSLEDLQNTLESLGEEYEAISGRVDAFQSSYSTLQDVISEYNQTGLLTADMLQSLLELEPQYLELLDTKNGTLSINNEKLGDMINSNDVYMNQLMALKIAEDANTIAIQLRDIAIQDMTESEKKAALASVTLSDDIAEVAFECLNGAGDANTFKNAIKELGEQAGLSGSSLDLFGDKVFGIFNTMQNLSAMFGKAQNAQTATTRLNRYYTPKSSGGGGSTGSKKSQKDVLKEELNEKLEVYEHTIYILEKNSNEVNKKVAKATQEALDNYNEEMKLVTEKGIDLSQTIFGNIDTNSRQILEWTDENLQKYQEALLSWGQDLDELRGSFSTLLGSSAEYDGIEIAFSPILQTDSGPVLLNQSTVDKYIYGLIEKAGEGWHNEDLFRLDTQGLVVDGQFIKNLLADIGETAIQTGEAMHYVGELGSVAQAKKYLEEVKADNLTSAEQQIAIYKKMQEEIHALAEKYRAMGLSEDSSYIRELSEKWWKYQDEVVKLMDGIYDATIEAHENALSLLENQYNRLDRYTDYSSMTENLRKQYDIQRQIQEAAHNEAQRLRKMGVDENDEAIQACIKAWWGAEDAIQEINSKIEESILNTYDDFISMADKFDLWDYMDISKVDYLHEKLGAVNDMLQDGTISLKEYNAQLKEIGEALYEAQVEQFEKQKDDIEKEYEQLIKKHKQEIETLKEKKEVQQDYYDKIIEGYEKEIEAWEKKKEEIEDYYDNLIDNLQDVQKENERINKQVDYYNERQKIITNLEQAQARSGVAWREKEMEYQQQLIDLDEEWSRTQKQWNIEDQIAELQRLKESALGDIDKTIEKINQYITDTEEKSKTAIENIDNQIKGIETTIEGLEQDAENAIAAIDEDIKALSRDIAEAIKNGTADGLIDVSAEFDQATKNAIIALGGTVVEGKGLVDDGIKETAQQGVVTMNDMLFEPMKQSINDVANTLKQTIVSSAETAAKNSLSSFKQNLVQPLQSDLQNIMKETQTVQTANTQAKINKTINTNVASNLAKKNINSGGGVTNVFINNKVANTAKGYEKAQSILQKLRV